MKPPWGGKTPVQVQRRNERERRRVQAVNQGYEHLAEMVSISERKEGNSMIPLQLIDWEKLKHKKLTKAQTLKAAILYIEHLENLLEPGGSATATYSRYSFAADNSYERASRTSKSSSRSPDTVQPNNHSYETVITDEAVNSAPCLPSYHHVKQEPEINYPPMQFASAHSSSFGRHGHSSTAGSALHWHSPTEDMRREEVNHYGNFYHPGFPAYSSNVPTSSHTQLFYS